MLEPGVGLGEEVGPGPLMHAEVVLQETALHQEILFQLQRIDKISVMV